MLHIPFPYCSSRFHIFAIYTEGSVPLYTFIFLLKCFHSHYPSAQLRELCRDVYIRRSTIRHPSENKQVVYPPASISLLQHPPQFWPLSETIALFKRNNPCSILAGFKIGCRKAWEIDQSPLGDVLRWMDVPSLTSVIKFIGLSFCCWIVELLLAENQMVYCGMWASCMMENIPYLAFARLNKKSTILKCFSVRKVIGLPRGMIQDGSPLGGGQNIQRVINF